MLNPCVLPLLPIIAASALLEDRKGPIFLAFGLSTTTALIGFLLAYAGRSLQISETSVSNLGAVFLIFFGVIIGVNKTDIIFKFSDPKTVFICLNISYLTYVKSC